MLSKFSCYVPIVTPFKVDGSVDMDALASMVDWHIRFRTKGLVCFGTTGESATLTFQEKIDILQFVLDRVEGSMKIIANTGTASTYESVELSSKAKEMGADASLVIVPYYVKPSDRGCFEHFRAISEVGLDFILYHHPPRTGKLLSFELIAKIMDLPCCIGIKECSEDLVLMRSIGARFPNHFIFSGCDHRLIEEMEVGANGSIAAIGNIIPAVWQEIIEMKCSGKKGEAKGLFSKQTALMDAVFREPNPQGLKYALSKMGLMENRLRMPFTPVEEKTQHQIDIQLENLTF